MTNARTFRTARSVAGDIVSHFEGEGSERRLVMTAPSGSTHSIAAIVGDNRTDFDLHFQRFAKYHGGFAQRFDENDRLVNGDPCIENDGSFVRSVPQPSPTRRRPVRAQRSPRRLQARDRLEAQRSRECEAVHLPPAARASLRECRRASRLQRAER